MTTNDDLEFLQNEEQAKAFIYLVTPVIKAAVREVAADFASHEEVAAVAERVTDDVATRLGESLTKQVNLRFDELDKAEEERFKKFVQTYEARLETLATKEELSGVVQSGADNTTQIAALKAAHDERLNYLEKEAREIRSTDAQRSKEIKEIRDNSTKTAENAQKTSEAVLKLIDQYNARNEDIDREMSAIRSVQELHLQDQRRLESEIRKNDMLTRDIEGRWQVTSERYDKAMYGDEKAQLPGLVGSMAALRADMTAQKNNLRIPSWLFGTRAGLTIGLPLIYTATIWIIQHPDLIAAIRQTFGMK